ncbi:auxin-responsive protein SAUR72 [Lactuca sativa]|uniref:auxin-responsive protein SAUR72 n=1 Tax=Lactuca sativa TaxID=4236 RepID=UPI000CAE2891|nr:auxin-responsive protein SAUR72 [Lactuca sativa]
MSNRRYHRMKIMLYLAYDRGSEKKGLISKTWERCKSFRGGGANRSSKIKRPFLKKSRSWPPIDAKEGKALNIAPKGCFSVYVGPQRQRFVIRTEYANHPQFKAFLEEAECEYGYKKEGPLELPCEVNDFVKVLMEMEDGNVISGVKGCIFGLKGDQYESHHYHNQCKIGNK